MIHKITIENFLSIAEKQTIDFTVDEHAPNTETYRENFSGERVSPILGVLGANAHGKTNLLIGINQFIRFSLFSFSSKEKSTVFYSHHSDKKTKPISFSVDFSDAKALYKYQIKIVGGELCKETLREYNGKRGNPPYLLRFEQNKNGPKISGEWVEGIEKQCEEILEDTKHTTLLSLLVIGMKKRVISAIVDEFVNISNYNEDDVPEISEFYSNNIDIFEKAKQIIVGQDLGISDVVIKSMEKEDGKLEFYPRFTHSGKKGKIFEIGIGLESLGVRRLYVLLKDVLETLKSGGMLICDELDRSMHPHLMNTFLKLFKSRESNPKNAQIIFTTHEAYVLNLLDKEQIGFVEKIDNESCFYKLSDIKGVSVRDNYFGKYMAGTYGATPNF